jgi:hypothetical protein
MKITVLKEETNYNNIVDNATYDAVSQILEASESLEYGKNIPLTEELCNAAINRFFTTMAVNFNLNPVTSKKGDAEFVSYAQEFFSQYVPAIAIIGYDRMMIYSYSGDSYVKVSSDDEEEYFYEFGEDRDTVGINFTLDNYVSLTFPEEEQYTFNDIAGDGSGTNVLAGYVGNPLDTNNNGQDDWLEDINDDGKLDYIDDSTLLDPYGVEFHNDESNTERSNYVNSVVASLTDNVSYILFQQLLINPSLGSSLFGTLVETFVSDDDDLIENVLDSKRTANFAGVNQDYEYNDDNTIKVDASKFHKLRRRTIIEKIQDGLNKAFNEYNVIAKARGITYNFFLPELGMDEWNNTIDDISVLAFVQGLPLGYEQYYNNYSLGGARIVRAHNYYAETCKDEVNGTAGEHRVYHSWLCKCIPRNKDGTIAYVDDGKERATSQPDYPSSRSSAGIEMEFVTPEDAKAANYHACSLCI